MLFSQSANVCFTLCGLCSLPISFFLIADPKLNCSLQKRALYYQHMARGLDIEKCMGHDTFLSIQKPAFCRVNAKHDVVICRASGIPRSNFLISALLTTFVRQNEELLPVTSSPHMVKNIHIPGYAKTIGSASQKHCCFLSLLCAIATVSVLEVCNELTEFSVHSM